MKYILDSSVALKWVLAEPDSPKALRLRADYRSGLHELLAPDVFPIECMHALTKAERQGRLAPPQASVLWTDIMLSPPRLIPSLPLVPRAYAIASKARIGIYDCLYVALAEQEKCELITADTRLSKAVRPIYPAIIELATLP